ncbi:lectin MOA-related protein [Methanolobus sp. WCC4]|uniref:lectin MOA-related protein n=1 Tax=Methanolobus sp. WCC4 TaxID=3125784 RepID=UPI0030FBBF4F
MDSEIVGMGIAGRDDRCYAWHKDGTVSSGTIWDRDKDGRSEYSLPAGKRPTDIVGMGIAETNDYCYAWYKDGTVSSGTISDLDIDGRSKYALPDGKSPTDIVDMGIAGSEDYCYAWYKDGTVSSGTSSNLGKCINRSEYSLPAGKCPSDIVGMGIAETNNHCYAWYKDGTVSFGTISNLDKYKLLNSNEVKSLLRDKLGNKLNEGCKFLFADDTYYCSPISDIDRLVHNRTDKLDWVIEKYDCDDFALSLKYEFIKDAYLDGARRYPHCLGILWGEGLDENEETYGHAINVVVTDMMEVLFIEPQEDCISPPERYDNIYFIYF